MKFNFKVLTSLLLALVLTVSVFAAFEKQNDYTDGLFTDVPADAWYAKEVKSTYELGLMNGKGAGLFSPSGNVTVAEAITLCARVNSIYNGVEAPTNSTEGNWYDSYVAYGISNGFVKEGQFADYNALITRAQMAELFYDAMPDGYYNKINNITAIPDVDKNAPYYNKLLALYNAGIVMGSDEYGTYNPTSNIVRSEVAAIINRVAVPANRKQGSLKVDAPVTPVTPPAPAGTGERLKPTIYHIDDQNLSRGYNTNLLSGWDYKNLGTFTNKTDVMTNSLEDSYPTNSVSIKKDINPIKDGFFRLDTVATTNNTDGGFYFLLSDDNNFDVLRIYGENSTFHIKSGDNSFDTGYKIPASITLTVFADFDKKTGEAYVNNEFIGSFTFAKEATEITKYILGTTDEARLMFVPTRVDLRSNYLVDEMFYNPAGTIPVDWTRSGENVTTKKSPQPSGTYSDVNGLEITAKAGENSYAKKQFKAVSGKFVFTTSVHTPKATDDVYFTVMSGDKEAFTISSTKNNKWISSGGHELRTFIDNVWQRLRIEVDTDTDTAMTYINGKKTGEYKLANAVDYVDSLIIGINAKENITLLTDDVMVYPIHEYDDYVPVPVPAESKNHEIGVVVCNLWRSGHHFSGWQPISNFEEIEPVIGYYDEGNPETADWEIKFWAEHGVDFQNPCWYAPSSDVKTPIMPGNAAHLENAYFYAKYSDMVKFAILWENAGGALKTGGFEAFKEYIWKYWVEYYFTDDRYMRTVDNKAIVTGWTSDSFIADFGGVAGAKEAVDWMNEDIKKYGYDGIVILFHDLHNTTKAERFEEMANAGISGTYSYNLNRDGYLASSQINRYKMQRELGTIFNVATLGVGFNDVGWRGIRQPMATLEDYEKVALFYRDEYLPESEGDGTEWHSRLMFLSTWNEFGEGHYIMPCGEGHAGFGYLDVVRKVFTDDPETSECNVVPTEAQKARINQLYVQDHAIIDCLDFEEKLFDNYFCYDYVDLLKPDVLVKGNNLKEFYHDYENGVVSGLSNGKDFQFISHGYELKAEQIQAIHIRMKSNVTSYMEIFFATKSAPSFNQTNSFLTNYEASDEWQDLYFDCTTKAGWTGTVTDFRFDPAHGEGVEFEIDLIEFMTKDKTKLCDIIIDGNDITMAIQKEPRLMDDGRVMTVINLGSGLLSSLGMYNEYSRNDETLYLETTGHTLLMTVGSDKAVLDGKEVTMPFTYTLRDGLPYIDLKYVAAAMGHDVVFANSALNITTPNNKYFEELKKTVPFEYEFNMEGFAQGFTVTKASSDVKNGKLIGEANAENNPTIISPELKFDAQHYNSLEVLMKLTGVDTNTTADLYFSTDAKEMGADTKVSVPLAGLTPDSNGNVLVAFDLVSNPNWTGEIMQVRIEPFHSAGAFDIDYIRFIENPDVDPMLPTSSIRGGDAEDPSKNGWYNGGADHVPMPIVTDPEDTSNKCYLVESDKRGVSRYLYVCQDVVFEPGATYLVEFDVRIKCFNDDRTMVDGCYININIQYVDSTTGAVDHLVMAGQFSTRQGWQHVSKTFTINNSLAEAENRSPERFCLYSNPIGGIGVDYYIDNVVLTKLS